MREDWERQTPTVQLGRKEAAELLRPAFPGVRVLAVETASGGKANTNLKITLAGRAEPVLLRLFVRDAGAAAKEVAILRHLENRVAVPRVLHFAEDNAAGGHSYAVLEWVEATRMDLALAKAGPRARQEIARAAGHSLARIGEVTFPQSGFLAADLSIAEVFPAGAAGFRGFVHDMTAKPRLRARMDPVLRADLLTFVERESAMVDDPGEAARLTHCDYDPSNILVRQGTAGWTIAAVIDWEFAVAASPLIDLGHLLRRPWGEDPAFVAALAAGYRAAGGRLKKDWVAAAKLLDLLAWLDFLNRPGDHPKLFADAEAVIRDTIAGGLPRGNAGQSR